MGCDVTPRVTGAPCPTCGEPVVIEYLKEGRRFWFVAHCRSDKNHYTRRWRRLLDAVRHYQGGQV